MRSEASVDTPGSDFGIGGATEYVNCTNGAPGASAPKASRISFSRVSIGLVTRGRPETTADAGALSTFRNEFTQCIGIALHDLGVRIAVAQQRTEARIILDQHEAALIDPMFDQRVGDRTGAWP